MISIANITITCFAASYAVGLTLEISRLLFHARIRNLAVFVFAVAGLLAHSLFLAAKFPWSNWHDFCLLAAWVLAGAYLGLSIRRPQISVGVFLLPLVLILIGLGWMLAGSPEFSPRETASFWRRIHGIALLLGTAGVTLGFATGVMHLIQSYRLKLKLPPNPRFRLPSLEWLQRFNREALFISAGLLAIGLISGLVMNTRESGAIAWSDPVILSSGVLFLWLVAVLAFEAVYKPAREGRKVAYLTVASFLFLGMVLYFVLFFEHGETKVSDRREEARDEAASHRL